MKIDWSQIETVLLDMDGTLLDLHFDNYFWREHLPQAYAQKNALSIDDVRAKLDPIFVRLAGTLPWYCVDHWSDMLELDVMALKDQVADRIAYRPNAQTFLAACQRESDDVRMVTNGHRKVLDLKIEKTGIDRYFDQLICSHELDHPKEQQEFWHRLQSHTSFDPEKTLFIDDNEVVLESAEQYGIRHLFSIAQPDSQASRSGSSRFPMIEEFVS